MSVKLLKDLNFAEKINSIDAVTEAGKEMLNNYRAYVYSKPVNHAVVNGFISEASNYSFDTGVSAILESVNKFVKENNISWKLASVCESINNNNSSYNYINKVGVQKVEKLLEMNENDVVSYIKAGALKDVQYIQEVRKVCKEVYKTNVTEAKAVNYNVINPISYVLVNENKDQFFSVLGKTYSISEGKINEAVCSDAKFARINTLLENFKHEGEDITYEYRGIHGDVCKFVMNENGLTLTKGNNINEHFETAPQFMEYCNIASRVMNVNEKMNFMRTTNAIAEVFEAMDNIVVLDCAKLMQCSNGTVCAIIEGKENVNLTVFQSVNAGTSCTNYDYVVEAINQVIKMTGVDMKFLFEERIDEDCKKNNPEMEAIREQLEANKEAQYSLRKKKIAMLAEQYKNDPVRIALLNKVAKDLSVLENQA
jgi:hypothetical protein